VAAIPEGNACAEEYERRLAQRQAAVFLEKLKLERVGNVRLGFVVAAVAVIWFAVSHGGNLALWGLPALVILIVLFVVGDRVSQRLKARSRAVIYYERALERTHLRRNESGETGDRFLDPAHPYAVDLDLFGKHSLFQFLSVCRTRAGENLLAAWLLAPALPEEIRARHEAVRDLHPRLDLREDMAVLGEDFRSGGHPEALERWAAAPAIRIPPVLIHVAAVFSLLGLLALAAWTYTLFLDYRPRLAMIIVALIEAAIFFRWRSVVLHIAHSAEEPGRNLALLRDVLARIERETFTAPRLKFLHTALTAPAPASEAVAGITRLVELLESRDNWLVKVFGPLVLWTTQVSFRTELWRQKHGRDVKRWLSAVAEFEALSSFACLHYEHPDHTFPDVDESTASIDCRAIRHPLLSECVANDVALSPERRLLIVSGSNMSGKSTLLRTIGANTVLALAGAPVRAESMRLCRLNLGASIRTSDSLDGGISRFYAEILRIRQILELPPPALFLLDELLAGTNSHDRRIGAEAILRALVERGSMGLATTHDLALSAIGDGLSQSANVHFEDYVADGKIHFDYHMRPGVVTRSNAIELMRSIGLPV
jgi:hypothetical protein